MNPNLYYMEWDEFESITKNILNRILQEKIHIDTIIPILRGGAYLGNILNHYLKGTDISYVHVRRSESNEINAVLGTPILRGITNSDAITGKDVLIADDMLDKGVTMEFVLKEIKRLNPKTIRVAVLYDFAEHEDKDMYIVGASMEKKKWIVYPWEKEG